MGSKTKSPLKSKPLRNPGQSIDEEINQLLNEKLVGYYFFATYTILLAIFEWWRWYKHITYSPIFYSIVAIIVSSFSFFKIIKIINKVKLLKLGRDGEKAVGQFLDLMRERGFKVYHDIIGGQFNIDHIIICKHGIFTIETKTYSKPFSGKAKIHYDGNSITINGKQSLKDILSQAKAESSWLKDFFKESTGREFQVKPVIVFPGWWIENSSAGYNPDVWVLNPKALAEFIPKSRMDLKTEDVHLLCTTLGRFIRN